VGSRGSTIRTEDLSAAIYAARDGNALTRARSRSPSLAAVRMRSAKKDRLTPLFEDSVERFFDSIRQIPIPRSYVS
jgi:hypothetical protein